MLTQLLQMKPKCKETTEMTKIKKESDKFKGSNYIGINKNNDDEWSVILKNESSCRYICTVPDIHHAAILHDLTILSTVGLHAKTNFSYNIYELLSMLQLPNLIITLE